MTIVDSFQEKRQLKMRVARQFSLQVANRDQK